MGENLSGNWNLVPADHPYNVRRGQTDDHSDYDVTELNDMKDMAQVLGDIIKPGEHSHVLCSTPQFALSGKNCLSEKNKMRESIRKDPGETAAKSEEDESIKQRPVFGIKNTEFQYIHAVGNYQQVTAAKCGTETSEAEMAVRFKRSGVLL